MTRQTAVHTYMRAVRWNNSSRIIAAPGFIEPALPTVAPKPPTGERWVT
jgi:hypothetical protein